MLVALCPTNGWNQKCAAFCWLHMWVTEDQLRHYRKWFVCTFFVIIFEAVRFIHMKLLIEHAFPHRFAFHKKAFKTFDKFWICGKHLKLERRRMRMQTSSHPYLRVTSFCDVRIWCIWCHIVCNTFQVLLIYLDLFSCQMSIQLFTYVRK